MLRNQRHIEVEVEVENEAAGHQVLRNNKFIKNHPKTNPCLLKKLRKRLQWK